VSHHREHQQPGLGGALFAVYGVASESREIRVPRYLGHLFANMLKHARDLVWHGRTVKPGMRGDAGR